MAKLYKSRLDRLMEEMENSVYVVEENGKKVADTRNNSLPSNKINNRLANADIAPFQNYDPLKVAENKEPSKKKKKSWFSSGAFSDGYDFGDITKTLLGSTKDLEQDIVAGALGIVEKTIDTGAYGIGMLGNKKFKNSMQSFIEKDLINEQKVAQSISPLAPLGGNGKLIDLSETNSIFGEKSDSLVQSGGQLAATIGLQSVGVPWWLTTGSSTFGGQLEEAFANDATYGEAGGSALISSGAEILSEKLSGGISFGGKTLDGALKKKLTDKISSKTLQTLTKLGFDAAGEGTEEVFSEVMSNVGKKLTYEDDKTWGELLTSEEAMDSYLESFIGGAVLGGGANVVKATNSIKTGKDYDTGYTQNEQTVIDTLVNEQSSEITKQRAIENAVNEAITAKEAEQGGNLSTKEKTAITEGIKAKIEAGEIDVSSGKLTNKELSKIQQEVEENLQKGLLDTNKIDSILGNTVTENDSFLQRSYLETARKKEAFTYEDKITNEQEKAVYDSATKYFNNTTRSHEFVEKVAKISKDKGTKYGFINNEELQSLGHDIEGKQVNGLVRTSQDGKQTVLINIDSPKALNTIVGHETTHLLEGTQEYTDLQEVIFNYAKEKGDYNARLDSLSSLYEGIENANVDSELTADLVGDYLFTDSKFIDSLSTQKPTVFQKIKELIDDLVVRFTGTKEEKALREVQKKFKEAYRNNATDTNVATNETQYSVSDADFSKSKVTDGKGNLLTLYHGTNETFDTFETVKTEPGYWFTEDKEYASEHGKNIMEVNLNLTNPLDVNTIEGEEILWDTAREVYGKENVTEKEVLSNKVKDKLKTLGYDGMIWEHSGKNTYIAFEPSQIKKTDTDTKYSLTDNQGRTLTKEQQEYFKDSKVRDENGNLLTMYHGTPYGGFTEFNDSHMGSNDNGGYLGDGFYFSDSYDYATDYTDEYFIDDYIKENAKPGEYGNPKVYETYLDVKNPYIVPDGLEYEQDMLFKELGVSSTSEIAPKLKSMGYDGVIYKNGTEVLVFNSNQIKNIDNTNPTSDADIRYSLTPDYGMQHRPSTDYGDASNFEENMPDVFEHPEWYFFGSDARSKRAYRESFEALKKVRNNPNGEITIYRATIGDTFNEGDWVSPSKTYAEWHNESNLDGKGKVIELKVKAKDIRFAGDDLNEFGYFPNGVDEYSLSRFNEQRAEAKGDYNVYGEDVKLQEAIAPLQEEIKELTDTLSELKEQIAPVAENNAEFAENVAEVEYTQPSKAELDNLMALQKTGGTEYANTFFGLRDKYGQPKLYKGINEYKKSPETYEAPVKGDEFAPITEADLPALEQQYEEAFNNIDESNMPGEAEDATPDMDDFSELTVEDPFDNRDMQDVGKRNVNAYQYEHPEVKPFFQQEAQAMLGDLAGSIKGERSYNDALYYETNGEQGFFGTKRQTTDDIAYLLDNYNYTYADIEKGLKAIIEDNGKENIAVAKRIEFMLNDRLMKGYTSVDGYNIPANQEYINMMKANDIADYYSSLPIDESMIPVESVDNSVDKVSNSNIPEKKAPVKEEYLAITPEKEPKLVRVKENPTYNEIAEVLVNEPKTENDRNKRKWAIFKANVLDKGIVFEDLALKENDRELIAKWDYTLTSEARGQYAIGKGHNGSKSLDAIRQEVDNTGLTKDFYNYMYHKHNVDRMSLASRFEGMENKPVFGDSVTADVSQKIVNEYENKHPEFMDFAQDVYDYVNADKQQLVDNGVISQETADLWSEMYPHYVPTRRTTDTGIDINVPLDTMKTGVNAPIKKATGGSADILPLFDTMAMRTLQTYRATAKNSFGVELMNTMGTTIESAETNVDEVIDSIDAQDGLLQEGKKGKNPTFTVFENGEKITFEITKDMYDALKPVSESSLLSKTIKPLNVAGNVRRGLLTEYNPTFMLTNAIKDTQDILLNSQHALKTYAKIPEAHKQLLTKGYWYKEYIANGGEQNSYFDNETNTFDTKNKGLKKLLDVPPLSTISKLNNYIEMIPRLSEYIASRESGRSIEVSMLDAARVTTNFKAGGAVTKWANRNGATFLNASVQGAMQQVRNIREAKANGVRGWVNLATKFAAAGLPAVLLNNLVWDDDEEYEDLSDYVKQNYYVIGKTDDGTFIRIPKGRAVAVIQEGINQMENLVTGDDEADLKSFIDLTINNLAPNNPLENNIFSPIAQVATNTAWYGGDLVPTRLQDLPSSEQYDESTDMLSRWIGETFGVSPYKVNYLLDQYSGGVGDVLLPMITPEATNDAETLGEHLLAPFKSKFTTNSTMNNQDISDFYDISEELITNAKKSNATDEDVLSNKYMNSIKSEMNELYKEKREIQNSNLSKSEKYKQVQDIQSQINELAENALSEYNNVSSASNYSTVGDKEYYKRINSEGEVEWTKINDDEAEDLNSLGLTKAEKNIYFSTKSEISSIVSDYKDNKSSLSGYGEDSDEYKKAAEDLSDDKKADIIDKIKHSGLNDEQKAYLYGKYYSSDDTLEKVTSSGISFDNFLTYHKDSLSMEDTESKVEYLYSSGMDDESKRVIYETSVLTGFDNEDKYKDYKVAKAAGVNIDSWLSYKKQEFKADKDSSGKSISGSRKKKIISYINGLDLSIPEKAILIRQEYSTFDDYNSQIVEYVSGLDLSYEEKISMLEELDMKVLKDGTVTWK